MTDDERTQALEAVNADNAALEVLAEAHGALLRAVQAIPNLKHSVFTLPQDMQQIEAAARTLALILGDAETKLAQKNEKAQREEQWPQ